MLTTTQTLAGFLLATAGVLGQVTSCSGSPCEDKVAAFPECAVGCIEEAALAVGCVHGDYQCHCSKIDELQNSAALCVVNACNDGNIIGKLITEQVPAMCACVAANPTPPCTAVPEPTVTPTPSSSTPPTKPTVIPTCPGKECAFPDPPQCVIDCMTPVIEPYKCSGLDDWNCMCTNIRAIARNANDCLGKTCASGVAVAFNNAAIKGCTCLGAACPSSSSSAPPPVTTTTPPVVDTTTTTAPPDTTSPPATCAHPCAASISAVPGCATACITSAASVVGCGNNDYDCRCASSAAIQNSAINCVIGACGIGEALNVPPAVESLCGCVAASPATSCEGAGPTSTGGGSDGPGVTTTTTATGGDGSGTTSTSTGDEGEETPCPEESSGQNSFVTKTVEVTTSICDEDDESSTSKPTAKPSCIGGCDGGDDDGDDDGSDDDGGDDEGGDDDGGDDEGDGPSPSFPSGGNGGGSTPTTKPPGGGSSPTPTGGKPSVSTAGAAVNVVKVGSGIAGLIAAVAAFL